MHRCRCVVKSFFASKYARARARPGGGVHAVHGRTRPRAYRTPGSGSSLVASTGMRVCGALPRRRSQCSHPSGTRRPNTGFRSVGIFVLFPPPSLSLSRCHSPTFPLILHDSLGLSYCPSTRLVRLSPRRFVVSILGIRLKHKPDPAVGRTCTVPTTTTSGL